MSQNQTKMKMISPRGVAQWPKLNEPDYKWDTAGKYTVKLSLDAADPAVIEMVTKFETMRDDFLAETVATLKADKKAALAMELKAGEVIKIERDNETAEPTGRLILSASMKASGTRKDGSAWTQKPDLFAANGTKLINPPTISGGSEMKVSFEAEPFINMTSKQAVVSIRLKAVQILKLSSGGVRTFSEHGFGAEDGDDIDDALPFAPDTSASTGSGGHDDL